MLFLMSLMKPLIPFKFVAYFIFSFLFFFLIGFCSYFKIKLPESVYLRPGLHKFYPQDIILKTGGRLTLPQDRFQQFLNFPAEKQKNTIRIGAFGDSYTFGDEVRKTASYPYYLQKLFYKNFPKRSVEVLNFGVSGTGLPEQFFLWDKYAKDYQLDYILLGPVGLLSDRNTSFSFLPRYPQAPKNRFILAKDSLLKEVHIKGHNIQERFKNYYSLFPSLEALRYDKQFFKKYEALFPFLKLKIKNQLYYSKRPEEEEAVQINKQLLKLMSQDYPKKLVFFTNKPYLYQLYKNGESFYNLNLNPYTNNFYKAFWHDSSLGNEATAQFYFNALIGNQSFFLNIISCYFKESDLRGGYFSNKIISPHKQDNSSENSHSNSKIDLDSVNQIAVLGQNTPLFNLKINSYRSSWKEGFYKSHKKEGVRSFFAFINKNGDFKSSHFLHSVYVPLSFQLKKGHLAYIQYDKNKKVKLGAVQPLDAHNKFFVLYFDQIIIEDFSDSHWSIYLKGVKIKKPGELFIGPYKLGLVSAKKVFGEWMLKFIPHTGYSNTFLMIGPQDSIQERDFPKDFPLFINYQTEDGKSIKSLIPNWTCRKRKQKIILDLPYFEPLSF